MTNWNKIAAVPLILMILILICCSKDKTINPDNGDCVSVIEGEWEFEWLHNGLTIIQFGGGNLNQSDCYLSYDSDNIFAGALEGDYWQGANSDEGFEFEGRFIGNSPDSFEGTWTVSSSSSSGRMIGHHVGN